MNKEIKKSTSTAIVVKSLEKDASPIIKKLEKITAVKTKQDYEDAAAQLKLLKGLKKVAEEKEKAIVDPLKTAIKNVQELFEPFIDNVIDLEKNYKGMMLDFINKQDEKKEKLLDNFSTGKIKSIEKYTEAVIANSVSNTNASTRTTMVVEVEDEKLIPREFLVPNMVKIKEAFKTGKTVKGCKYVQKKGIAI